MSFYIRCVLVVFVLMLGVLAESLGCGTVHASDDPAIPENQPQIPVPSIKEVDPCLSSAELELLSRLNGIRPTCEELTTTKPPVGRVVSSDFVWIIPNRQENYFYVLGAHMLEDGSGLITAWTGASLSGAIDQFCSAHK